MPRTKKPTQKRFLAISEKRGFLFGTEEERDAFIRKNNKVYEHFEKDNLSRKEASFLDRNASSSAFYPRYSKASSIAWFYPQVLAERRNGKKRK